MSSKDTSIGGQTNALLIAGLLLFSVLMSFAIPISELGAIGANGNSKITPPSPTIIGDSLENNDNVGNATNVSTPFTNANLSIHSTTDQDYFAISINSGQTMWANISFNHSLGDLDMELVDSSSNTLDSSGSTYNTESVSTTSSTNQIVYAVVYGYSGATNYYSITIEVSSSTGGGNNSSSQNDAGSGGDAGANATSAVNLSALSSAQYTGWVSDTTDSDDVYSISVPSGYGITASLAFASNNDFDLYLADPTYSWAINYSINNNSEVVSSNSTNFSVGGHTIFLLVGAWSGSGNYTLDVWVHPASSTGGGNNSSSQNDAGSGGDAGANATSAVNLSALSSAQYTGWVSDTTDSDDVYSISVPSGYGITASLAFASNNDFDLYLADPTYSWAINYSINNNSEVVSSNSTNFSVGGHTIFLLVGAWSGSGNYTLDVWVHPDPSAPSVNVVMPDKESANTQFAGLNIGTNYSVIYQVWDYPIGSNGTNWTAGPYSWTANTTSFWDNVTFSTTGMEGFYGFGADLYASSNIVSTDFDFVYYEMLETAQTGSTSGTATAQNLTVGQSYTLSWEVFDNVTNTTVDSGSTNFSATSSTWNTNLAWTSPATTNQHYLVAYLYNNTNDIIGYHEDDFTPQPPSNYISWYSSNSAATTNSIQSAGMDMIVGDNYSHNMTIFDSSNTPFASSNLISFTAQSTSATLLNWTYSTPNASGTYCAYAYLWSSSGTLLDTSQPTCFVFSIDSDGDGVTNDYDLCPNTTPGLSVDADGCADNQKDTDGDGYMDDVDAFPQDPTQWSDGDGDGYGDNSSGNLGDAFPQDSSQWSDIDGDGYGDNANGNNSDAFPTDPTQWADADGDGFGDNANGNNPDKFPTDPTQWADGDGDGYGDNANGNNPDKFPTDPTQWSDSDGDGYGDNASGNNPDEFPSDPTQWSDSDGDGYGDNPAGNAADAFPQDPTQWTDQDGDGYGDNQQGNNPDVFPQDPTQWADGDGDGYGDNPTGNDADAFTNDSTQWSDGDGDGYGDNANGNNGDECLNTPAGEVVDEKGCSTSQTDEDLDGVMDNLDLCPGTTPGLSVNFQGCAQTQIDDDMDGVNNTWDSCANTPPGANADLNGCSASQRDSDNDLITDDVDQCPNTMSGLSVDSIGCADSQKDGDGDQISDDIDICPSTPSGESVDSEGCSTSQKDSDGDEIMDNVDLCQGTPLGLTVDNNGCADAQKDSDEDGYKDDVDQCPASESGVLVNSNGCSSAQRDGDGDSFSDALDQCPNTPNSENVDSKGCSESQKDSDEDGIADDIDLCPYTTNQTMVNEVGCSMSQKDSDGDGVTDDIDDFPNDANETTDSDGDGVADRHDAYPNDPFKSAKEEEAGFSWIILLTLLIVIGGGAATLLTMRGRQEKELVDFDPASETLFAEGAQSLYDMAGTSTQPQSIEGGYGDISLLPPPLENQPSTQTNAGANDTLTAEADGEVIQWQGEDGVHWTKQADGSLIYFDPESGQWINYQ